jgi:hypothetical protein
MSMPSYWFDPMVGGGGGVLGGNAATGQPALSSAQIMSSLYGNYSPGAAQSTLNNIYGPGGFGAQPAAYAAAGAAYGRQTGGFGGYGAANADPFTAVGGGGNQVDPFSGAITGYSGGGIGSDANRGNQGGNYGANFNDIWTNRGAQGLSAANLFNTYAYTQQQPQPQMDFLDRFRGMQSPGGGGGGIGSDAYRGGQGGDYGGGSTAGAFDGTSWMYNPATYAGSQGNYGIPYNGRPQAGDIGYSRQPSYPNLGYNPGMQNLFANPAMGGGAFQGRFGMGFPNAGTPSQYAPGAQMPPGFSGAYSADNPSGALPLGSRFNPYGNAFNQ